MITFITRLLNRRQSTTAGMLASLESDTGYWAAAPATPVASGASWLD